jgi:hypothetical protein
MGNNDSINPKVQESLEENNHKFLQVGIYTSEEDFEAQLSRKLWQMKMLINGN